MSCKLGKDSSTHGDFAEPVFLPRFVVVPFPFGRRVRVLGVRSSTGEVHGALAVGVGKCGIQSWCKG